MKKIAKKRKVTRSRKSRIFLDAAKTITKEIFLEILKTAFPWLREVEQTFNFKTYVRRFVAKFPIRYLIRFFALTFL